MNREPINVFPDDLKESFNQSHSRLQIASISSVEQMITFTNENTMVIKPIIANIFIKTEDERYGTVLHTVHVTFDHQFYNERENKATNGLIIDPDDVVSIITAQPSYFLCTYSIFSDNNSKIENIYLILTPYTTLIDILEIFGHD